MAEQLKTWRKTYRTASERCKKEGIDVLRVREIQVACTVVVLNGWAPVVACNHTA